MTLVVCHYPDLGARSLQVWADTRVSGQTGTLTDSAPKIFVIPTVTKSLRDKLQAARATYGFAYAGSSLVANCIHAVAVTCLGSLSAKGRARPPSVKAVAEFYSGLASRYSREIGATVDFFIIGFCARDAAFRAFRVVPESSAEGMNYSVLPLEMKPATYWSLDSGEQAFAEFGKAFPDEALSDRFRRFIEAGVRQSVGGRLQAGVCTERGFLVPLVIERIPDSDRVSTWFSGIDTRDLSAIDDLDVGTFALGPKPLTQRHP